MWEQDRVPTRPLVRGSFRTGSSGGGSNLPRVRSTVATFLDRSAEHRVVEELRRHVQGADVAARHGA